MKCMFYFLLFVHTLSMIFVSKALVFRLVDIKTVPDDADLPGDHWSFCRFSKCPSGLRLSTLFTTEARSPGAQVSFSLCVNVPSGWRLSGCLTTVALCPGAHCSSSFPSKFPSGFKLSALLTTSARSPGAQCSGCLVVN